MCIEPISPQILCVYITVYILYIFVFSCVHIYFVFIFKTVFDMLCLKGNRVIYPQRLVNPALCEHQV